jgi:hypothetical protein
MRPIALSIKIAVFASGLISCASLAQTCGAAEQLSLLNYSSRKLNSPFSATVQTTHTQKFPDGNIIYGEIITHYYRDSIGRIHDESTGPCSMVLVGESQKHLLDGRFQAPISVTVSDPTNHTRTNWVINGGFPIGGDETAQIFHNRPLSIPPPVITPEQRTRTELMRQYQKNYTHTEKLPDGKIAGVSCEHRRSVTTTPAGEQGNELPMESTNEECIAHDIGVTILRVTDSPLSGHTETRFIEFTPGEPDPSVFNPPPGYTIKEQPTNQ